MQRFSWRLQESAAPIVDVESRLQAVCKLHSPDVVVEKSWSVLRAFGGNDSRREVRTKKCGACVLPKDAFRAMPPADRVSRGSTQPVKLERRTRRDSHSPRLLSYFCGCNMRKSYHDKCWIFYRTQQSSIIRSPQIPCGFLNKSNPILRKARGK